MTTEFSSVLRAEKISAALRAMHLYRFPILPSDGP